MMIHDFKINHFNSDVLKIGIYLNKHLVIVKKCFRLTLIHLGVKAHLNSGPPENMGFSKVTRVLFTR